MSCYNDLKTKRDKIWRVKMYFSDTKEILFITMTGKQ